MKSRPGQLGPQKALESSQEVPGGPRKLSGGANNQWAITPTSLASISCGQ